jgi:recombinational DNA repair protein (RecF pathway)
MVKRCEECGRELEISDWYEYIRRKYCPACAAAVKRRQNANRMQRLREITRQQNQEVRKLCAAQQDELRRLRELVAEQRARICELTDDDHFTHT